MQISLQSLFVVLGYCALFCVAILHPGPAWVMVFRSLAGVSLLFALLAIIYRTQAKRAFWVGYLHGACAYALLTFYSLGGFSESPVWKDDQIVSGELARIVYQRLPTSHNTRTFSRAMAVPKSLKNVTLAITNVPSPSFRYLFHSAFTMLCGWLGGLVGMWLYATRGD